MVSPSSQKPSHTQVKTHNQKMILIYLFFFKQIETPWITTTCLVMETLININIWWKTLQERERGRVKGHSFWPALNLHTTIALSTQYKLIRWSNKHTGCCEKRLDNGHLTIRMSVHSNHSLDMKVLCTYYSGGDRKATSLASGHLYNNIVISEMKAIMWLNKSCFNARAGKCINHNIISVSFLSIYKSRTRSWLEWDSSSKSQKPLPLNFCLLEPF